MQVAEKHLDPGAYTAVATANLSTDTSFTDPFLTDLGCELRNDTDVIGSATTRHYVVDHDSGKASLSLNGGYQVPDGGGNVSLWCRVQHGGHLDGAQVMITHIAGFF